MVSDSAPPILSEFDQGFYRSIVPADHYLRRVLQVIPWDDFHDLLAPYYSQDMGRPAESPVLMLKLEYLRYHHNLSDREVIARAETDLAFRYFLRLPLRWNLPDPSSLCIFRGRLGVKGFRQVFNQVVHMAREQGVVKDRLRIKVATHVIGNMAVPTAQALEEIVDRHVQRDGEFIEAARGDAIGAAFVLLDLLEADADGLSQHVAG